MPSVKEVDEILKANRKVVIFLVVALIFSITIGPFVMSFSTTAGQKYADWLYNLEEPKENDSIDSLLDTSASYEEIEEIGPIAYYPSSSTIPSTERNDDLSTSANSEERNEESRTEIKFQLGQNFRASQKDMYEISLSNYSGEVSIDRSGKVIILGKDPIRMDELYDVVVTYDTITVYSNSIPYSRLSKFPLILKEH